MEWHRLGLELFGVECGVKALGCVNTGRVLRDVYACELGVCNGVDWGFHRAAIRHAWLLEAGIVMAFACTMDLLHDMWPLARQAPHGRLLIVPYQKNAVLPCYHQGRVPSLCLPVGSKQSAGRATVSDYGSSTRHPVLAPGKWHLPLS